MVRKKGIHIKITDQDYKQFQDLQEILAEKGISNLTHYDLWKKALIDIMKEQGLEEIRLNSLIKRKIKSKELLIYLDSEIDKLISDNSAESIAENTEAFENLKSSYDEYKKGKSNINFNDFKEYRYSEIEKFKENLKIKNENQLTKALDYFVKSYEIK